MCEILKTCPETLHLIRTRSASGHGAWYIYRFVQSKKTLDNMILHLDNQCIWPILAGLRDFLLDAYPGIPD